MSRMSHFLNYFILKLKQRNNKLDEKTVNVLVLIVVMSIIISAVLLYGHIQRQRDDLAWEYYTKFIRPEAERAKALGIPDERIYELYREAISSSVDPTIIGGAPGSIFNSLIDREVEKENQ